MNRQIQKKTKRLSARVKFLIAVLLLYMFIFFFNSGLAVQSIVGTLGMLAKIVPILIVVFIIMIGVNLMIGSGKITKYLGRESGVKGWVNATLAGILISGPPYVLYPLLRQLKEAGMKENLLAVFLYNRNVKIPFVPVMTLYFGWTYTFIFSIYIIIFSILNGMLVKKILDWSGNYKK